MDIEEVLSLCKSRNVTIAWRYDYFMDKFIVRIWRDNYCVEKAFSYEDCLNVAFGLTIRVVFGSAIDEIDTATGGKKNG